MTYLVLVLKRQFSSFFEVLQTLLFCCLSYLIIFPTTPIDLSLSDLALQGKQSKAVLFLDEGKANEFALSRLSSLRGVFHREIQKTDLPKSLETLFEKESRSIHEFSVRASSKERFLEEVRALAPGEKLAWGQPESNFSFKTTHLFFSLLALWVIVYSLEGFSLSKQLKMMSLYKREKAPVFKYFFCHFATFSIFSLSLFYWGASENNASITSILFFTLTVGHIPAYIVSSLRFMKVIY